MRSHLILMYVYCVSCCFVLLICCVSCCYVLLICCVVCCVVCCVLCGRLDARLMRDACGCGGGRGPGPAGPCLVRWTRRVGSVHHLRRVKAEAVLQPGNMVGKF